MLRRSARLALVVCLFFAACGIGDAGQPPTTTATGPATTTTQPSLAPTSTAPTTTPTTVAVTTAAPTTTTMHEPAAEIVVTWDGEACVYDGPASVASGELARVTFRNDGGVPADLEIDYLSSGVTLEEIIAAWPEEISGGVGIPTAVNFVAGVPEFPNSAGPGQQTSADVTFNVPRLHAFICWGGGSSSNVQTVDVAPAALIVEV